MVFRPFIARYNRLLKAHPYKVNAVQTSALVAFGDVISQQVIEKKGLDHDKIRTLRMALMGVIIGPTIHGWYSTLGKWFGESPTVGRSLSKVAVDQLMFAPACIASFLTLTSLMQFRDPVASLQNDYTDVLVANYKLWPAVQIVTFSVVPLYYRTLFVQIVSLGWNTYLTWKVHDGSHNK